MDPTVLFYTTGRILYDHPGLEDGTARWGQALATWVLLMHHGAVDMVTASGEQWTIRC